MSLHYQVEFKSIEEKRLSDISNANYRAALEYLEFYKQLINNHNFSRHEISILAAMGSTAVMVDGKFLHERPNWKESRVLKLLQDIEESLDYEWAYHLDGMSLN